MTHFKQLEKELSSIKTLSAGVGVNAFYAQEVLRFYSIAGTLLENFDLDDTASVDQRYLSHILSRSLLENYFWILYLYDDPSKKNSRYDSLIDSFKKDYFKLMNEPMLNHKNDFEPADPAWKTITKDLDINSMLAQVKNDYGDRLSYIYFVYRISSFDTHGKSLSTIFQSVFGKQANFPILKLKYAFDLIANQYLVVLKELKDSGEI
ncbi:hypothetical protein [Vibrio alginolyticus]|uniref:hypothetical protein n=1 Tax=Vibrio alginolyticus TaxID=663 RepID=UPI0010492D76|nr:hypothetical protein [Vibrio alginolyticus]TDE43032.1 hypothetical protein E1093_23320 [Vibrio alginolyticus]